MRAWVGGEKGAALSPRGRQLLDLHQNRIARRCDRLFVGLFVAQWVAAVGIACRTSPRAWAGSQSWVHPHVWMAAAFVPTLLGLPIVLIVRRPGAAVTRHAVAAAQVAFSGLLIHLTGGRIESHFHIFGSLAFLAFYRDWRVLVTATAVVAGDHLVRGLYLPRSIFGTGNANLWRVVEHVGWVAFEDVVLVAACLQARREMAEIAARQAANEQATVSARADWEDLLTALNAGTIVAMTDADGRVTYANDRFCQASGHAREELIGRPMTVLDSGNHPPAFWADVDAAVRGGGLWTGEVCNRAKDGRLFWVSATTKGLLGPDGRLRRAVTVQADITAQKAAELHRAQAQRLESIGQLAAGIAHEINTPTQYVGDNIRFAQEGFVALTKALDRYDVLVAGDDRLKTAAAAVAAELDLAFMRAEVPPAIAQALEGLGRVTEIVRAMKDFSHPGSTNKEPADLNRAILSTVEVCRNRWKFVADVLYDLSPGLPPVPCLVAEFNQVVLNLIVNAADALGEAAAKAAAACGDGAAPRKGQIRVGSRLAADDRSVEVTVSDNGPGIPPQVQARLFEPFFTTKPVGKGTGQGLTLSRNVIVGKHGGSLTCQSSPGKGTTFIIRLPMQAAGTEASDPRPPSDRECAECVAEPRLAA